MEIVTESAQETRLLGKQIADRLIPGTLVCLYGDLGSGKTTLAQGIINAIGNLMLVSSPTYTIVREYLVNSPTGIRKIYHLDLYRIQNTQDLQTIGISEILGDKEAVKIIEWAEKLRSIKPKERIDIRMTIVDINKRSIKIPLLSMKSDLEKAINILNQGGILIYPTDTAFGIGCRIDNHQAVDHLFNLRKRPRSMAMPVLVSSVTMALNYLSAPSSIVRHLMERYWPGALTIVAPARQELIYGLIRGGRETIGLRMPNHLDILAVIEAIGVPILGPSANFHGEPTPYRLQDLNQDLFRIVDFVLPGECSLKQTSTVIDTTTSPPTIIRRGALQVDIDSLIQIK